MKYAFKKKVRPTNTKYFLKCLIQICLKYNDYDSAKSYANIIRNNNII